MHQQVERLQRLARFFLPRPLRQWIVAGDHRLQRVGPAAAHCLGPSDRTFPHHRFVVFAAAILRRVGRNGNTRTHIEECTPLAAPIAGNRCQIHEHAIGLDRGRMLVDAAAGEHHAAVGACNLPPPVCGSGPRELDVIGSAQSGVYPAFRMLSRHVSQPRTQSSQNFRSCRPSLRMW